jgi:hypothetical protein
VQGDAEHLELAAAEMAQSAATLVQLERELERLPEGTDPQVRQAKMQSRMEAAAMLGRKMAAMEAQLAARRITTEDGEIEAAAPVVQEEREVAIPSKPPVHISTGPAAGDGREIILQVCAVLWQQSFLLWTKKFCVGLNAVCWLGVGVFLVNPMPKSNEFTWNVWKLFYCSIQFSSALQGFNWESCKEKWYSVLASQAKEIGEAGFTSVWFPPPSDSVSPQGYLPRDLYLLDSSYGTEAELRECIQTFTALNIKVVADIVINHRCAHKQVRLVKCSG